MASETAPFAAPAWLVALAGAAVVLLGSAYFFWRARGSRSGAGKKGK
jgi:hypothetical protein